MSSVVVGGGVDSLWLLTTLLLLIIMGYIAFTLPVGRMLSCAVTRHTKIQRPGAKLLIGLFVAVYTIFIYQNEFINGVVAEGESSRAAHHGGVVISSTSGSSIEAIEIGGTAFNEGI